MRLPRDGLRIIPGLLLKDHPKVYLKCTLSKLCSMFPGCSWDVDPGMFREINLEDASPRFACPRPLFRACNTSGAQVCTHSSSTRVGQESNAALFGRSLFRAFFFLTNVELMSNQSRTRVELKSKCTRPTYRPPTGVARHDWRPPSRNMNRHDPVSAFQRHLGRDFGFLPLNQTRRKKNGSKMGLK